MSSKATKQAMEDLHRALAEVLKEGLTKKYYDEAGNEIPPPSGLLNAARQFLKDNDIQGYPTEGSPLDALKDRLKLPFGNHQDDDTPSVN